MKKALMDELIAYGRLSAGFCGVVVTLVVTLLVLGSPLAGCQSKTPAKPRAQVQMGQGTQEALVRPGTQTLKPEHAFNTDPCAARLQDISGQLLLFYALNRKLPDRLDDLKPMADIDADTNYTCPVTGQPYQYAPQTLRAPGLTRLLVVYDAAPDKTGKRWCILIAEPKPGKPLATWVEALSEPIFRSYTPVEQ